MATLTPAAQDITDVFRSGLHLCITKVVITGTSSDTVSVPEGLQAAAHVTILPADSSSTVPSVSSISQSAHPQGATVTIASGGTAGATMYVLSFHSGSAAGL